MKEIMKDIPGFEGEYAVTPEGQVYSYKRNKFLKPYAAGNNIKYLKVKLGGKNISVSRLVAEAFIPNPNNLPDVDHEDRNPFNNNANNLRWCTRSQNCRNRRSNSAVINVELNLYFPTLIEAAEWVINRKLSRTTRTASVCTSLCHALNGDRKTSYGYTWRRANGDFKQED